VRGVKKMRGEERRGVEKRELMRKVEERTEGTSLLTCVLYHELHHHQCCQHPFLHQCFDMNLTAVFQHDFS
jgi:hypothetical protein